jgi:hypothetical protein
MESEDSMRRTPYSVGIALFALVGCSSKGSSRPDAASDLASTQPETGVDLPASPTDSSNPNQGNDAVAQSDLPSSPDAAVKQDVAPSPDMAPTPDVARSDSGTTPPDTAAETGARKDLSTAGDAVSDAAADAIAQKDLAATADALPGADLAGAEAGAATVGTVLGGCQVLPTNHIFNTPIDSLPVHASSSAFMSTIGTHNIHLDLGTSTDMTSAEYYGIPYNVVNGNTLAWTRVSYSSTDTDDMTWDPLPETDCVDQSSGSAHTVVSPCLASKAPKPWLPIPSAPLVEGGIVTDPTQPYGDHHMLIVDADTCRLWELYHCYPNTTGGWDIFGSSTFDLNSNALRPADWTSADAAGFPILPLLILESEASSGEIRHALRFTISSSSIRNQYVWPARHLTTNGSMSASLPPMGQLFRIKASYQIPASYGTQSRAILQALKTYGMYIADGGSNMYIQGDPSMGWQDSTFSQVQSVGSSQFEAVDLSPIMNRAGFDSNSAAVPTP